MAVVAGIHVVSSSNVLYPVVSHGSVWERVPVEERPFSITGLRLFAPATSISTYDNHIATDNSHRKAYLGQCLLIRSF